MREDIVGIYVTSASWNIVPINMVNYISLQESKKDFWDSIYLHDWRFVGVDFRLSFRKKTTGPMNTGYISH